MKEDDSATDDFLVSTDRRNLSRRSTATRYGRIVAFLGRTFIRKRRILLGFYIV